MAIVAEVTDMEISQNPSILTNRMEADSFNQDLCLRSAYIIDGFHKSHTVHLGLWIVMFQWHTEQTANGDLISRIQLSFDGIWTVHVIRVGFELGLA